MNDVFGDSRTFLRQCGQAREGLRNVRCSTLALVL